MNVKIEKITLFALTFSESIINFEKYLFADGTTH